MREIYALGAVKRDMVRRAGVTPGGGVAALASVRRNGPSRIGAIAEDQHVDLSVASRQVSAMEGAGWVERRPDPRDRRSSLIAPTPAGEAALSEFHDRILDSFAAVVADWDEAELTVLAGSLARLREAYTDAFRDDPHAQTAGPAATAPATDPGATPTDPATRSTR